MAAEVRVERDSRGRLVVRKLSLDGDTADRAAEAAWLVRAAGCPVVELVEVCADPPGLVTLHAGSHTWRTAAPGPATGPRLLAAALRALAAVHDRGLVHGAVGPDHLIVRSGRVVLCSPDPSARDPLADRLAVADLVEEAARRWRASGAGPASGADWERAVELLRRPESGWGLADIADVLDGTAGPGPAAGSAHPDVGHRTAPPGARRAPSLTGRRGRAVSLTAGAVAVVASLTVVGALAAARWGSPRPTTPDAAAGPRFELSGARYRSAGPHGVLVATDRPCPGSPVAALLRPADGVVWAFPALPTAAAPIDGSAVAEVPGATGLALRRGEGCEQLVVNGPAGEADLAWPEPVRTG